MSPQENSSYVYNEFEIKFLRESVLEGNKFQAIERLRKLKQILNESQLISLHKAVIEELEMIQTFSFELLQEAKES